MEIEHVINYIRESNLLGTTFKKSYYDIKHPIFL